MKYTFPYRDENEIHPGMTLLDYMAGQALVSLTNEDRRIMYESNIEGIDMIASYCYKQAAAMLREREK